MIADCAKFVDYQSSRLCIARSIVRFRRSSTLTRLPCKIHVSFLIQISAASRTSSSFTPSNDSVLPPSIHPIESPHKSSATHTHPRHNLLPSPPLLPKSPPLFFKDPTQLFHLCFEFSLFSFEVKDVCFLVGGLEVDDFCDVRGMGEGGGDAKGQSGNGGD